jgi:hypothetical protein
VDVGHRRGFEVRHELREILVTFARETDDDVGADGGVGDTLANVGDERGVLLTRVRTAHRRQHPIGRMLKGQMKVRSETRAPGNEGNHLGRAVRRLERADAEEQAPGQRSAPEGVQELDQ